MAVRTGVRVKKKPSSGRLERGGGSVRTKSLGLSTRSSCDCTCSSSSCMPSTSAATTGVEEGPPPCSSTEEGCCAARLTVARAVGRTTSTLGKPRTCQASVRLG